MSCKHRFLAARIEFLRDGQSRSYYQCHDCGLADVDGRYWPELRLQIHPRPRSMRDVTPKQTLYGLEIRVDPSLPPGEARLVDADGNVKVRIVGIKTDE